MASSSISGRAVDQSREVLDILVPKRRDAKAAQGSSVVPRAIVTDKLISYACTTKDVLSDVAHHLGWRLNNRAENSH
jgi:putative transposase